MKSYTRELTGAIGETSLNSERRPTITGGMALLPAVGDGSKKPSPAAGAGYSITLARIAASGTKHASYLPKMR